MNTALTLARNGAIEAAGGKTIEDMLRKLPASERRYIQRMSEDLAKMAAAKAALDKEERRLARRLAETPDGVRLDRIRRKKKLAADSLHEMTLRVQGAMEAAYEEYMPGATFGEKVAELLPDTPRRLKQARRA